jgi:hypothetical protein
LTALEDSAVGGIVLQIAPETTTWEGSSAELLAALTNLVGKKVAASACWLKNATQFSSELRHIAPQLYMYDMFIKSSRHYEKRLILITRVEVPITPASGVTTMPVES